MELPAGRITFVFTDIEGSTQLFARLGRRFLDLLEDHRRIVRHAVAEHGGAEVKTEGDGFFLAFGDALAALDACIEIQRELAAYGDEINVRIGAHIGDAEPLEADYYTFEVHEAARIGACGHGGQIVVSEQLRDAVDGRVSFVDLGRQELKDLEPMRLYQVAADGLRTTFPPLRTVGATRGYVPAPTSSLVGRSGETAALVDLITRERLVTITGAGGVGKTRLAVQVAGDRLGDHADGVWFVDLAPTTDPALLDETILDALGVVRDVGVEARSQLKSYLRSRDALIVLDNCEHVIDPCSTTAHEILRNCERVRILATSREPLGVEGEVPWRLPSLDASEAVALFEARARVVQPEIVVDEAVIEKIAERLDGIPLAIELAAARCRVLTPQQILDRLDDRFRLLTGGSRTALARQRTLEATVDWSYNLLDDDERSLLRHVSVFLGGFDLDAADAVWERDALDVLERLVDKSIVTSALHGSDVRYRLLETIRDYGWTKLLDEGEVSAARDRHLRYFDMFVERVGTGLFDAREAASAAALGRDHDNIRAAIEWGVETDIDRALHVLSYMWWYWSIAGATHDGKGLLRRALDAATDADPDLVAAGRTGAAQLAWIQPAPDDDMRRDALLAVERYRERGGKPTRHDAWALFLSAVPSIGGLAYADTAREALDAARADGAHALASYMLADIGYEEAMDLDLDAALADFDASIAEARTSGSPSAMLQSLGAYGAMRYEIGRLDEALAATEEAVAIGRHGSNQYFFNYGLLLLARQYIAAGRSDDARSLVDEVIGRARVTGLDRDITRGLIERAWLDAEAADHDNAEASLGAAIEVIDRYEFRAEYMFYAAEARHGLAEIAQLRGDFDAAEARYKSHLDLAQQLDNPPVVSYVAISLSWLEIERRNADAAQAYLEIADASAAAARPLQRRLIEGGSTRAAAGIALLRGDADLAAALTRSVETVYEPNERVPRGARLFSRRLMRELAPR